MEIEAGSSPSNVPVKEPVPEQAPSNITPND